MLNVRRELSSGLNKMLRHLFVLLMSQYHVHPSSHQEIGELHTCVGLREIWPFGKFVNITTFQMLLPTQMMCGDEDKTY